MFKLNYFDYSLKCNAAYMCPFIYVLVAQEITHYILQKTFLYFITMSISPVVSSRELYRLIMSELKSYPFEITCRLCVFLVDV